MPADVVTWQMIHNQHPLTDYVAVYIFAAENVVNDGAPNEEFHGHYADDVSLQLTGAVPVVSASFGAVKGLYVR